MFFKKKKQFNVRKVIFSLRRTDGTVIMVETTGKIREKKFLFFKWYEVEYANPEKIVAQWGTQGFIKVDTRDFMNINKVDEITYKTMSHIIEK